MADEQNYLIDSLNPQQREAVLHEGGPLLILAGAGSGKTRVITHRIAHLIREGGIHPQQILAVTFTNKAAREMRERVERLLQRNCRGLWISTFHSACARLLRSHISLLGYTSNFVIYDTADQKAMIRACMKELNINEKMYTPDSILGRISRAKNDLISSDDYAATAQEFGAEAKTAQVYELYRKTLKGSNALDFDDLLFLTVRLFEEEAEIRLQYQERFQHILVDEYQDTNHAQYRLIKILAAGHRNLCVVGDDDQGIYSWRGADIGNILSFREDYPDLKVIQLEQNYRSTQNILTAAWHVVERNRDREPKKLWTENGEGEQLDYFEAPDEMEETDFVCRTVSSHRNEGMHLSDMAVFYRTNAQSRVLEEGMRKYGLPYRVVGGLRFYDRKEVRDLLAYLRVIANPKDSVNLRRILNVPPRGIGATTLARLEELGMERRCTLYEALKASQEIDRISKRPRREIGAFLQIMGELIEAKESHPPSFLLEEIDRRIGYTKKLKESKDPTDSTRLENIQELYSALKAFEEDAEDSRLEAFLESVALISDADTAKTDAGVITLMTLHSAKGLEFPVVFLTGMEEGLFPHGMSLRSESGLEEERRLCYVGMTRAKEKLYLTSAQSRRVFGTYRAGIPSRFLREIPAKLLNRHGAATPRRPAFRSAATSPSSSTAATATAAATPFAVGCRVRHPLWGFGTVTTSIPTDRGAKVTVHFQQVGSKKLIAELAGLQPI
ncbi:MAG: DNA helicase PcrA [Deltaproteobacteria bacterium]|nr:DNA helicase PcrA [Deltaproteobacteria bacterium]